jgi:hypothetical protein
MSKKRVISVLFAAAAISGGSFALTAWRLAPPDREAEGAGPSGFARARPLEVTDGERHLVPLDEIVEGGPARDDIPSIDLPSFERPAAADEYLADDGSGIAIGSAGRQRFYPFQILVWHEAVNDVFSGLPIVVTYAPLSGSAAAYVRTVGGKSAEFGVSGKLYEGNTLLYDRASGSLWSQALGMAVAGDASGASLEPVPLTVVSWKRWKSEHPDGEVLSRKTGFERDYTRNPYGNYARTAEVWFPLSHSDGRLPAKSLVYGLRAGSWRKAYPADVLLKADPVNDALGEIPVLVTIDPALDAVLGFRRETDGRALTFSRENGRLRDEETGSVWTFGGEAVSGPLQGTRLERLVLQPAYWFAWSSLEPETLIFQP